MAQNFTDEAVARAFVLANPNEVAIVLRNDGSKLVIRRDRETVIAPVTVRKAGGGGN